MTDGEFLDPEFLRGFFELDVELLCVMDREGRFLAANPAWDRDLGRPSSELVDHPIERFVHPEDIEEMSAELRAATAHSGRSFLARFRHRDGEYRWLRWSVGGDRDLFVAARDVTNYRRAADQAAENEQLWRSVLSAAVDPIIVIDSTGLIVRANAATSQLFGYAREELLGSNVTMLMPEPYRSEHDGYLRHYLETGEARIIGIGREVEARRADGSVFPMALAVSEVPSVSGKLFTGIIHDLTTRREAQAKLEQANELLEARVHERTEELARSMAELARSNRDLEQFAYIASHDLQAPLRNVRQGLELLDEHLAETVGEGFDYEARELRDLTVGAVGRMEELIQGLLAYSRVNRRGGPELVPIELGRVADEALGHLRLALDEAEVEVSSGDLPTVRGDEVQLQQLFQNLIQNAVKYRSPERDPRISISAASDDGRWVISVADNGIGVDADQHQRIFELFRRGHSGYDGVGIGLAICDRIVEQHGGTIWVTSEPDEGATFTFTLPALDGGNDSPPSDPSAQHPSPNRDQQ